MRVVVVLLILALCILHHDVWWWDTPGPLPADPTAEDRAHGILFGFMPIGLAWHAFLSLAAGFVWYLATKFCWPKALDDGSDAA